jgi:cellulose synthase/poly-beta-1,6-N-acetylglucosamine synthase-like glycosyltransferase
MIAIRWLGLLSAASLVIVWFGYPLAIHLLARTRRARARGLPDPLPRVTVVIATRDAPEAVAARVANVLATDYDPARLDVVVTVDRTAADLVGRLQLPDTATVVTGDAPGGKAAALNAGVRAASGDILVFSDTYQRFDARAIGALVSAFADSDVGAASGALDLPADGSPVMQAYWGMERRLRRDEARISSVIGVTGAIYAMRRSLWRDLPDGLILDDLYGPMRLILDGHRIDFVESARATDRRVTDARQEYRRKVRTLTGNIQLCAWLPGVFSPVRNPVWAQFMLHKLLRLLTPYWVALIGIWLVAEVVRALPSNGLIAAGGAAAALTLWLWLGRGGLARRGRSLAVWAISLQAAVVRGTWFGLRRRWEVW